jgi:hypothetical protein
MLQKSASTKYVSVLLDNKLSWAVHISKRVEKTIKRLGLKKRLAGATWGSTQDALNFTYNISLKCIMKYGSEVIDTTNKANMNHHETAQNNALSLICGAVKTTPVTALQIFTENLPISLEIQKLAAAPFIKVQVSSQASWISQHTPHQTLKIQLTPINNCRNFLNLTNIPTQIEPTIPATNPLDFITVATNLSLTEDLKKKDTPPMVLKLTTLEMVDFHYPEKDLLRVNTDGSQVGETNTAGAGVHCKLCSQHATVGVNKSNFDGELEAICLALQQLLYRLWHLKE